MIHRRPQPQVKFKPASEWRARKILVIPDLHDNPQERKDRFHWIGRFARDIKPDLVVSLGDVADFDSLCGHISNDSFEGKLKPQFTDELASLNEAMAMFNEFCPKVPKHVTLGNHEHRIWRFQNDVPEIFGMMEHAFTDILTRHGWTYTKYGEYKTMHGIDFTHRPFNGMGKPFGGMNAAVAVARDAIRDTVFGDSHKLNFVTKAKLGPGRRISILEAGCAFEWGKVKEYAKNSQTGWWWGVHVLSVVDGSIQGLVSKPMFELERDYG